MEKHFAALNLLDLDSNNKLTRSCSYSNLQTSRCLYVKQSYLSEYPPGLIRQYSCEQIFDNGANTRQLKVSEVIQAGNNECRKDWQTTVPYSDSVQFSNWQFCKSNNAIEAPEFKKEIAQNEIEYMDVEDVDSTVQEPKFISYCQPIKTDALHKEGLSCLEPRTLENVTTKEKQNDVVTKNNTNTYENVKKKLRPLVPKQKSLLKKKTNMYCCNCACLFVLPIAAVIIALFLNPSTSVCNRSVYFSKASSELQQKIYGQEKAITNIIDFLSQDFSHLKVMCIAGGTGVGKSYTAEIIKRNYLANKIFVHDRKFDDNISTNMVNSLEPYTLLIIENLKMKDLDIFAEVLEVLKEYRKMCITVLAIFNVEDIDDHLMRDANLEESEKAIHKISMEKQIDAVIVPYTPLNEKTLTMCITDAALLSNLKLTDIQIDEVKQMLISSGSGCKGAYAKVQIAGRE